MSPTSTRDARHVRGVVAKLHEHGRVLDEARAAAPASEPNATDRPLQPGDHPDRGERWKLAEGAKRAHGLTFVEAAVLGRHIYRDGGQGSWESARSIADAKDVAESSVWEAHKVLVAAGLLVPDGYYKPKAGQRTRRYRVNFKVLRSVEHSGSRCPIDRGKCSD